MTKLIVGLGNPGKEYEKTRHNVGFFIVDALAQTWGVGMGRKKFQGYFGEYLTEDGTKIVLLKPQTYMNLSGDCVGPWVDFLKVPPKDILVVHDDLDLPLGRMKAQWAAGPAGHNGIRSIHEKLGHKNINRLRIGVGHPGHVARVIDHVLSAFSKAERAQMEQVKEKGVEAIKIFIKMGLDPVSQMVNRRNGESSPKEKFKK
jgi:PTH1 family peptidyl-tRNA hydrolase